jgi:protein gp37
MGTKIEWTHWPGRKGETWNPVTGCTKVSEGCRHCYAKRLHDMRHDAHGRGKKVPKQYAEPFEVVQCHEGRLDVPVHWKAPRCVFVNSMSDLFHAKVGRAFIWDVFGVMEECPRHVFIVLTKRPSRATSVSPSLGGPLPNVILGVSVEDQSTAEERLSPLAVLHKAGWHTMVSIEPMLGPVNLRPWLPALDWAVAGGESGPNARCTKQNWARDLRDDVVDAGVPFFWKQWGDFGGGLGTRMIDGREWNETPEVPA